MSVRTMFLVVAPIAVVISLLLALSYPMAWVLVLVIAGLVVVGLRDISQPDHAILRNYPVIGHGRYIAEKLRPELLQYFIETDIDGRPFSRTVRSVVYQRAKGVPDKVGFGTLDDVYEPGYEFVTQSLAPKEPLKEEPRFIIGGADCTQPYSSSYLNISAMSYGSISSVGIQALNKGAARGGFAHNTGEGGVSPHHLSGGGDLIWQIGTGYFGCRTLDGSFDPDQFTKTATRPEVKMIELKLSQGAKPGQGGLLPAEKVTPEVAEIRGVSLGSDVASPPSHRAFSGPLGLLEFVGELRRLSGGKPVGFKLCVGQPQEFVAIGKAMLESGILPDFITVDGSEGGTGAAPFEMINSVGMPMREGLSFVNQCLIGFGLRDKIKVIGAGKVATGFDLFRILALGADGANVGRSMMLALGCIQTLRCHTNECPVGVATQNPALTKGLDVADKAQRVANYHAATIKSFLNLMAATGLNNPDDVLCDHVLRRVDETTIRPLGTFYDMLEPGSLLDIGTRSQLPSDWTDAWNLADSASF